MALCTVAEVRSIVDPKTLTDSNISDIIDRAGDIITLSTGASTSSTDTRLNLACIHQSAALTLQKMKYTGELAQQIKLGDSSQSNSVESDIKHHEQEAQKYMKQYRLAISGYSILYGRAGIKTVNSED